MKNATLILILVLGFFLRLHYAHLDPYLHAWDERYHALVAKNLMDDPLLPLLRAEPLVPYDNKAWCCNHIWVHKQPALFSHNHVIDPTLDDLHCGCPDHDHF